ncbi:bacteriohemerythrin [Pseudodesulfovibrio sp. zrk46]|uniref:bacteriohemerythrin n=1 Tax=Pseudodesulfovibrio sp. zrk46 TaxID=2725288 RepID=UPI001449BC46|nr:bacteriohemerythrin [Pseudodesulfovibrio sp. zrk46]QJB56093.1 hemerythrin family protein [Pseudodesulfovibrio sp. zrk46]
MDDQHKRLIQLVNSLVSVIRAGVAEDLLGEICRELYDYTNYHFRDEESLMQEEGYPEFEAHCQLHAEMTTTVKEYLDELEKGKQVSPNDVLEFLAKWLVKHILKQDMKFAAFVKEKRTKAQREAAETAAATETQQEVDKWLSNK